MYPPALGPLLGSHGKLACCQVGVTVPEHPARCPLGSLQAGPGPLSSPAHCPERPEATVGAQAAGVGSLPCPRTAMDPQTLDCETRMMSSGCVRALAWPKGSCQHGLLQVTSFHRVGFFSPENLTPSLDALATHLP